MVRFPVDSAGGRFHAGGDRWGKPLKDLFMPKATLLEIARKLNLSKSTVSVALRDKAGVSEPMRARIKAEAARLDYRPDPVAGELMAMVRSRRQKVGVQTIAFINTFHDPKLLQTVPCFCSFYEGAKEMAELYGYKLEVFNAFGGGMRPRRLSSVLKSRGIRGVLIGARWMDEPDIEFDWGAFSCVLVGEARYGASLYRVCNHHVQSCSLALRKLVDLGYRRIGVMLDERYESSRGFDYLLGVDEARHTLGSQAEFIGWMRSGWNKAQFVRWVQENQLDAVLSQFEEAACARELQTAKGNGVAYACLVKAEDSTGAGIEQYSHEIGRASMEMLRSLLNAGERGTIPHPRITLIEGRWVDGETAPSITG